VQDIRQSLADLKACWDNLQGQMDDKEARMARMMEFQTLYQGALQNISAWLDEVELKLFSNAYDEDTEAHLAQSRSVVK
jgi:hypothetical protein